LYKLGYTNHFTTRRSAFESLQSMHCKRCCITVPQLSYNICLFIDPSCTKVQGYYFINRHLVCCFFRPMYIHRTECYRSVPLW